MTIQKYFWHLAFMGLSSAKMTMAGCLLILYGKVSIGDLSYQGNIYVVDKYSKINIPVHLLKNEKDTTAHLARLDFKQGTLDFVRQETISKTNMHRYKMVESSSLPIIETTLFISDTYGHQKSTNSGYFPRKTRQVTISDMESIPLSVKLESGKEERSQLE